MISYEPLWETMRKKKITQYRLLKEGVDNKTLDALKKGKNITMLTAERLCRILDCTPNEIVRFTEPDGEATDGIPEDPSGKTFEKKPCNPQEDKI